MTLLRSINVCSQAPIMLRVDPCPPLVKSVVRSFQQIPLLGLGTSQVSPRFTSLLCHQSSFSQTPLSDDHACGAFQTNAAPHSMVSNISNRLESLVDKARDYFRSLADHYGDECLVNGKEFYVDRMTSAFRQYCYREMRAGASAVKPSSAKVKIQSSLNTEYSRVLKQIENEAIKGLLSKIPEMIHLSSTETPFQRAAKVQLELLADSREGLAKTMDQVLLVIKDYHQSAQELDGIFQRLLAQDYRYLLRLAQDMAPGSEEASPSVVSVESRLKQAIGSKLAIRDCKDMSELYDRIGIRVVVHWHGEMMDVADALKTRLDFFVVRGPKSIRGYETTVTHKKYPSGYEDVKLRVTRVEFIRNRRVEVPVAEYQIMDQAMYAWQGPQRIIGYKPPKKGDLMPPTLRKKMDDYCSEVIAYMRAVETGARIDAGPPQYILTPKEIRMLSPEVRGALYQMVAQAHEWYRKYASPLARVRRVSEPPRWSDTAN